MTCINCQQEVTGKFCPHCGQRTNVKRITFREGWNDFWSRVYGFDGMFPRTIRDLTLRPGVVARHYVNGNRVLYYGPVGYFFLMLTLYILVISFLQIDMNEMAKAVNPYAEIKEGSGQEQFNHGLMGWIKDNQRIVSFIFVPFYVFGAALFSEKVNSIYWNTPFWFFTPRSTSSGFPLHFCFSLNLRGITSTFLCLPSPVPFITPGLAPNYIKPIGQAGLLYEVFSYNYFFGCHSFCLRPWL